MQKFVLVLGIGLHLVGCSTTFRESKPMPYPAPQMLDAILHLLEDQGFMVVQRDEVQKTLETAWNTERNATEEENVFYDRRIRILVRLRSPEGQKTVVVGIHATLEIADAGTNQWHSNGHDAGLEARILYLLQLKMKSTPR